MPCYEFYCEDCKMPFEVILTLHLRNTKKATSDVRNVEINECIRRLPLSSP